jgi:hypothetical protein
VAAFNRPTDLPVDQVRTLRSRGFDNNQIVQALQRTGYTSTQIFDALNQADLVNASGMQEQGFYGGQQVQQQMQQAQQPSPAGEAGPDIGDEQVEEMIETIVEEKWQAVSGDINKIMEWKNDVDAKLIKMDQKIEELRDNFDKLHQAVIGKVGEYDKNILSVGAELKAMEKVFSKVLPVFTDNVNELNRITQSLSSKKQ